MSFSLACSPRGSENLKRYSSYKCFTPFLNCEFYLNGPHKTTSYSYSKQTLILQIIFRPLWYPRFQCHLGAFSRLHMCQNGNGLIAKVPSMLKKYLMYHKRSMNLDTLLDNSLVWQVELFCRLVSKTHCCRLKQFIFWATTLTQYLTMHVSVLDRFQQLHLSMLALD